jgi:hypothetical protein
VENNQPEDEKNEKVMGQKPISEEEAKQIALSKLKAGMAGGGEDQQSAIVATKHGTYRLFGCLIAFVIIVIAICATIVMYNRPPWLAALAICIPVIPALISRFSKRESEENKKGERVAELTEAIKEHPDAYCSVVGDDQSEQGTNKLKSASESIEEIERRLESVTLANPSAEPPKSATVPSQPNVQAENKNTTQRVSQ